LTILGALAAPFFPWAAMGTGYALIAIIVLNRDFFRFLSRKKGVAFASLAFTLQFLYYCCCGASVLIALALWQAERLEERPARIPRHERADVGAKSMPRPAIVRWARRLSAWRSRSNESA